MLEITIHQVFKMTVTGNNSSLMTITPDLQKMTALFLESQQKVVVYKLQFGDGLSLWYKFSAKDKISVARSELDIQSHIMTCQLTASRRCSIYQASYSLFFHCQVKVIIHLMHPL